MAATGDELDEILKGLECDTPEHYATVRNLFRAFIRHKDRNMVGLNLVDCGIITLPPAFFTCEAARTRLERFNCGANLIVMLPGEIGMCAVLTHLYCHRNRLEVLPPELGDCARLTYLWCRNNQLKTLPPELGDCAMLEEVDCRNNRLKTLPPELGACPHLGRVFAEGNPFEDLPMEFRRHLVSPGLIEAAAALRTWWDEVKARRVKAAR